MTGRVTVRGRGGEHKRRVRIIDNERIKGRGGIAIVERGERKGWDGERKG